MNKIFKKNSGFTLVEVMVCIVGLGLIAGMIALVGVGVHFICKFW